MTLGLGIDTGGTCTDSAVVDLATGEVLAKGKALTTRGDLVKGIRSSLALLDAGLFPRIGLVGLSTTLATNSIVEGKGSRVGLIFAVPNPETFTIPSPMPADHVAVVAGAHDRFGAVTVPLDLPAAEEAILRMAAEVDAFAVTGYFSIYNGEHEQRLKELVAAACSKPVVCGVELSGDVGMLERGATAALNARLLPVIGELLAAVGNALKENGIRATLMVVKGDGSLIRAAVAAAIPVETVLSGPAASVVGACKLTGLDDAVVVDMGGTTTDIAVMRGKLVATSRDGAVVGGWKTRVHAVDMWTVGLGGDSRITVRSRDDIRIGPRRAIPLSLAAVTHPGLAEAVSRLGESRTGDGGGAEIEFFTLVRKPNFPLSSHEELLIAALDGKILDRRGIMDEAGPFVSVDRFVELGFIAEIAFTPTDLLHARGDLFLWDGRAANAAAQVFAGRTALDRQQLLELVFTELVEALKLNVTAKMLAEIGLEQELRNAETMNFLHRLLRLEEGAALAVRPRIKVPLVAVGAPVRSWFPRVAGELGAQLVIPVHAEVANAVGAVTGRVVERAEAHIRPFREEGFMVVTSEAHKMFGSLEEAVSFAEESVRAIAVQRADRSGGQQVEIVVERHEETAPLAGGWGDAVLLEVRVIATAVGRPVSI